MFQYDAMIPTLIAGTRVNVSLFITLALSLMAWIFMQRSFMGYKLKVGGLAPRAAGYAGLGSAALSLVFAVVAMGFRANQVAAGLAIGILGQGLSALFGKTYKSLTFKGLPKLALPGLSEIPVIGKLFVQDIVVWISLVATLVVWVVLAHTWVGLAARAIGENPKAAHAIGYPVIAIRVAAIAFGGMMAGFAAPMRRAVYTPLWADGMIAGRGWIAIALVVFGTWLTGRIFRGACLFGAVSLMSLAAQATGLEVPSQLLSSLSYLVTIIVLGIISGRPPSAQAERRRLARRAF